MQSCVDFQPHPPQLSPPPFRGYSPHQPTPPSPASGIKEEASATASPASGGGGGGPAVSAGGGGGFYGAQHCYLPAAKKGDSLPRLGMLGGSPPGMYSVWPPQETHGKGSGHGPASPSSGWVHWMSMMTSEQMSTNPHDQNLWNEVGSKMNNSDQHNALTMHKGPTGSLDKSRGVDTQMHNLYASHANRANSTSSGSPPVSTPSSSGSMLVVPQPISAASKGPGAPPGVATNGTGRKYQCKMCPQIFLHKSAMQHHAREIHRGEVKPHQCQQCLKSFSSNHQLTQHIRIHTGEKPYKCSYCDRRFKQLSHVQQHTRLHTGERPYKCHLPECGRAFIQLSNLQQHLRNHDSQMERAKNRPFHCNICGKGFASESSLRTHRSKQHAALIGGANSQSCPVCHKICLNAEALMDHMRTAHKDPNASGTPSKQKQRVRPRFRTPDHIAGTSSAELTAYNSGSPSPLPSTAGHQQWAPSTTTSLIGMGMAPFVLPPHTHYTHHPLARGQPSFLNL